MKVSLKIVVTDDNGKSTSKTISNVSATATDQQILQFRTAYGLLTTDVVSGIYRVEEREIIPTTAKSNSASTPTEG